MQLLKRALVSFGILVFVLLLISLLLPSRVEIKQTSTIKAPIETVFSQINDLKAWEAWSPWVETDPDMNNEYSPSSVGAGAWNKWASERVGNGKRSITRITEPTHLDIQLDFEEGNRQAAEYWKLEANENGTTRVTWNFHYEVGMNPMLRFFALKMERDMKKSFEDGLENLKKVCEKKAGTSEKNP